MSNTHLKDQPNNKHQIGKKSDIKFDLGKSELNEKQKLFLNQNRDVFATNLQENKFI